MKMSKTLALVVLLVFSLTALVGCGGTDEGDGGGVERIAIATGGTSGTYYPVGGAIGQIINNHVDGVEASIESTGASIANMNMLANGEISFIMAASNTAFAGFSGEDPFEGEPIENMRAVTALYPEVFQFVVRKDSGLTSIEDIVGKKVVVGAPGSGTERTVSLILEAHGITYDDIEPEFLSFGEGVTALKDRLVDVAVVGAGIPTSAVVDAAASMDITLLSLDTPEFQQFTDETSFFFPITIPAGTYQGVDEDILTGASPALLIATDDTDEELVYNILTGIFDNLDILADAHVQGRQINLENAVQGVSLPWHPGAERFFEEKGVLN